MENIIFYIVKYTSKALKKIAIVSKLNFLYKISNSVMKTFLIRKYFSENNILPEDYTQYYDAPVKKIWVCWFQGVGDAPEIVKACISSIVDNKPDEYEFIIIDDFNYSHYIDLPKYIIEKYQSGYISKAQFSDILRVNLLYTYGGIWIDATIFLTKNIFKKIDSDCRYFSIANTSSDMTGISQGRWAGYFIYAKEKKPAFKLLVDFFNSYWRKENNLIDYFLIDYAISIVYDRCNDFSEDLEKNSFDGRHRYNLDQLLLSNKYDDCYMGKIFKENPGIYKLSHKKEYNSYSLISFLDRRG